jgi:S1-C subfamily serine protease
VRYGAVITSVRPGSPGDKAGLLGGTEERDFNGLAFTYGGDVLVAIDGRPVRNANDVSRAVAERLRPGQTSTFTVVRDQARRQVKVVLGTRPRDPNAR